MKISHFVKFKKIRIASSIATVVLLTVFAVFLFLGNSKTVNAARSTCNSTNYTCSLYVGTTGDINYRTKEIRGSGSGITIVMDNTANNIVLSDSRNYYIKIQSINTDSSENRTLIVSGTIFAKNILLSDMVIVTHSALTVADSATLMAGGDTDKRVDLNVSEKIIVQRGSVIDVTGKGYPGGRGDSDGYAISGWSMDGYGPGGGAHHSARDLGCLSGGNCDWWYMGAAGGSSYADSGSGRGLWSTTSINYAYNSIGYGVATSPKYQYGSGGGYAFAWNRVSGVFVYSNPRGSNGANGGGKIMLQAKTIRFVGGGAKIKANGASPDVNSGNTDTVSAGAVGGGGGGGYIQIKADNLQMSRIGSSSPIIKGGDSNGSAAGSDGRDGFITNNASLNDYIKSKILSLGGDTGLLRSDSMAYGGGGGGGYVEVVRLDGSTVSPKPSCTIGIGDKNWIPAECDSAGTETGSDVYIDGYNPDGTKYWQPGHSPANEVGRTCSSSASDCQAVFVVFSDIKNASLDTSINAYSQTKRSFNSVVLFGKVALTHKAIVSSDIINESEFLSTKPGSYKKVDIDVTAGAYSPLPTSSEKSSYPAQVTPTGGNIYILYEATINTNGMGFPSSTTTGYGEGRPGAIFAGPGYGGVGGYAYGISSTSRGPTYSDQVLKDSIRPGSSPQVSTGSSGGNGGGVVRLKASSMILWNTLTKYIQANGTTDSEGEHGGSGGTIELILSKDPAFSSYGSVTANSSYKIPFAIQANGGDAQYGCYYPTPTTSRCDTGTSAGRGSVYLSQVSLPSGNASASMMTADGGSALAPGGGGRIYVHKNTVTQNLVKKTIASVKRGSITISENEVTGLQIEDEVTIVIDFSGLKDKEYSVLGSTGYLTITDTLINYRSDDGTRYRCRWQSDNNYPTSFDGSPLIYRTPATAPVDTVIYKAKLNADSITYTCQVVEIQS